MYLIVPHCLNTEMKCWWLGKTSTSRLFLRILLLLHSFHHIHNWHITIAPSSRQDLFSRVTWWMKINFAFSNTPTWSPSPSPLSSSSTIVYLADAAGWEPEHILRVQFSFGSIFFSKYHILGLFYLNKSITTRMQSDQFLLKQYFFILFQIMISACLSSLHSR